MRQVSRRAVLVGAGAAWCAATLGLAAFARHLPGTGGAPPRSAVPAGSGADLAGHILARCTWGPRPGDRAALLALDPDPEAAVAAWIARQLDPAGIPDEACERALAALPLHEPAAELYEYHDRVLRADLATATLRRALLSERQLLEQVVALWNDHFNIDASKAECRWLIMAHDREVVRRHALGRFADLLRATALSPAMLWYLDGRANRGAAPGERPNENYARELLELHTLGVHGGYTQRDVMEVARCLTGWTVRDRHGFGKARVEFLRDRHDDGPKQVLGHTIPAGLGAEDLDRVLAIVAAHPATARRIAARICRRFIAEEPPAAAEAEVAAAFTGSGGDLRATIGAALATAAFRDAALRGGKLKRPFHLVASSLRATGAVSDGGPALVRWLQRMGHEPFQYPTPEGCPDTAADWRDGLLWRWRFAVALADGRIAGTRIDVAALVERAGGEQALLAHLLGRTPGVEEQALILGDRRRALALALASPAFQRC